MGKEARRLTVDSDADVSLLERGRVIHTVSGHAHHVPTVLQDLDDGVLMLWEDLSKAVRVLDQLVHILDTLQMDDAFLGLQVACSVWTRARF